LIVRGKVEDPSLALLAGQFACHRRHRHVGQALGEFFGNVVRGRDVAAEDDWPKTVGEQ
jgi:hypothetical protein